MSTCLSRPRQWPRVSPCLWHPGRPGKDHPSLGRSQHLGLGWGVAGQQEAACGSPRTTSGSQGEPPCLDPVERGSLSSGCLDGSPFLVLFLLCGALPSPASAHPHLGPSAPLLVCSSHAGLLPTPVWQDALFPHPSAAERSRPCRPCSASLPCDSHGCHSPFLLRLSSGGPAALLPRCFASPMSGNSVFPSLVSESLPQLDPHWLRAQRARSGWTRGGAAKRWGEGKGHM